MKRRIREAIVVEGRYDKDTLSQLVDAPIIPLDGFAVFHNKEKQFFLRRLAEKQGLILLTDSDGAGFLLRGYLKGVLPPDRVKQAYIPELSGKERRKRKPGKAGLLGVEGMKPEILLEALRRAGATFLDDADTGGTDGKTDTADIVQQSADIKYQKADAAPPPVTKADLYAWGLSGGEHSAARRESLLLRLSLPRTLNANALLEALNLLYTRDELEAMLHEKESLPESK